MEKNCWYYINSDGTAKGWYKEGYEPKGYKKYTYTNGQTVKTTVHMGNHVYMYALWDEFYIQYALNQEEANGKNKMIPYDKVLKMDTGRSVKTANNKIDVFKPYKYYKNEIYKGNYVTGYYEDLNQDLTGYNIYRKEVDGWMYIKGDSKSWFKFNHQTSGYTLYKKAVTSTGEYYINKTGNPGDHIILEAVWADSSAKTKSCQRRGLSIE